LLTARQALELATRGGAHVIGRKDIGSLETGKCADFTAINLDRIGYAGGMHDPVASIVFCAPRDVDLTVVAGKVIVRDGRLVNFDEHQLVDRHNRAAKRLMEQT
jgi:cytosine/adenosine deaminase-related metal-dependent hydrolase